MNAHDELLFSIWCHGRDAGLTLEQIDEAMAREIHSSDGGLWPTCHGALFGTNAVAHEEACTSGQRIDPTCPSEAHSALRGLDAVVDAALNQIHESGVVVSFPVRSPSRRDEQGAA